MENEIEIRKIVDLARKYLSAPPASVSSEQLFSATGLTYEALRKRLMGENAAKLLFIKYQLCGPPSAGLLLARGLRPLDPHTVQEYSL